MLPNETPTLYTSTESDGALAEIAFRWSQLSPIPSKPAALHRIRLTTRKSLRLVRADLINLGVDWPNYTTVNYQRTRAIGAAAAHLECDGLIAPSARWSCDNVMVFFTNLIGTDESAILLDTNEVDWLAWAKARGRVQGLA